MITEYDPKTCITAKELRECKISIPESIPDCAWCPRASLLFGGDPKVKITESGEVRMTGVEVVFTMPLQWINLTISIGE